MLALRTSEGITADEFNARCGLDLQETYGPVIDELLRQARLEETCRAGAKAIRITADSLFVSNEILGEFF